MWRSLSRVFIKWIGKTVTYDQARSPIIGSSYIPTPKFIESRKAVLNVNNKNDHLCFLYSVLAHIHPVDKSRDPNEVYHYKPFLHELDYSGLTFPLKIRQIRKFEDQNQQFSINVLYHDSETSTIMPLRLTDCRGRLHHVNLFMLYNDGVKSAEKTPTDTTNVTEPSIGETSVKTDEPEPKYHYTLVRNLSALIRQNKKSIQTARTLYICPYCIHVFYNNKSSYQIHLVSCNSSINDITR